MICGVIDIGSNTVRLSIFKTEDDQVHNLFNEKESVGLASYKKKNALTDDGISHLINTLKHFKTIINNFSDIEEYFAIATASLRGIKNEKEVLERVKDEVDIDIEIISGDMEARLAFLGASQFLPEYETGILADIGGGSTEIVRFHNDEILDSTSINIGSLTAFREFVTGLFFNSKERKKLGKEVKKLLKSTSISTNDNEYVCAVGGSARASLKLYNDYYGLDPENRLLNRDKLKKILKKSTDVSYERKFKRILRLKADRIHTLLPGMCILYRIVQYFDVETVSVSETGIREGYVHYRVLGKRL